MSFPFHIDSHCESPLGVSPFAKGTLASLAQFLELSPNNPRIPLDLPHVQQVRSLLVTHKTLGNQPDPVRLYHAQLVFDRRMAMNMSQGDVAKKAKTTQQLISAVETAIQVPRDNLKLRIAEALSTYVKDIFPYPDEIPVSALIAARVRNEKAKEAAVGANSWDLPAEDPDDGPVREDEWPDDEPEDYDPSFDDEPDHGAYDDRQITDSPDLRFFEDFNSADLS